MKYIYSTSQMSKLSLILHTFSITSSVAGIKIIDSGLYFYILFSLYFIFIFIFLYFLFLE